MPKSNDLIMCPNPKCDYRGPGKKEPRGNLLVGLLLTLAGVFPGLLYLAFMAGSRLFCPRCGMQVAEHR